MKRHASGLVVIIVVSMFVASLFSLPPRSSAVAQPSFSLTVSTDQPTYSQGSAVLIQGSLTGGGAPISSASVSIVVQNPSGAMIFVDMPTTGSNGQFSTAFTLPQSADLGQYAVTAAYQGASAQTLFTVVQVTPPPPPPPPPITTTQITTTSQCIGIACGQASAGVFSGFTAVALSSIPIPPPAGAGTFPDGLFSFTVSGLSPGQTVSVAITLSSPLPAGTFSYWKFQGNTWIQFPSASLDSSRRIIFLMFTVPAGSTSISDPGGPAIMTQTITTTTTTHSSSTTTGSVTLTTTPQVYITVTTSPLAFGNPQGGGTYPLGSVITISVGNVAGYNFIKWVRDGVDYTSQQSFAYSVDAPHTFTAIFQASSSISVIVNSVPAHLGLVIDGMPVTTPCVFSWVLGSSHTLSANSPVSDSSGTQYVWTSWSDGGAQSHTVTPSTSTTYTANFEIRAQTTTTTHTTLPPATTQSAPPLKCIIATAAYGSEMAPEVVYMRYVRDNLIGSTTIGHTLVEAFNTFYYSWSPLIAQAIADYEPLRDIFRILLIPLVAIVHLTAFVFTTFGAGDLASAVAFTIAAALSTFTYIVLPTYVVREAWKQKQERAPHS